MLAMMSPSKQASGDEERLLRSGCHGGHGAALVALEDGEWHQEVTGVVACDMQ